MLCKWLHLSKLLHIKAKSKDQTKQTGAGEEAGAQNKCCQHMCEHKQLIVLI